MVNFGRQDNYEHEHTFLPLQQNATRTVWEKVPGESDLYKMVDYMYMFCKCGHAIMTEVNKTKLGDIDGEED